MKDIKEIMCSVERRRTEFVWNLRKMTPDTASKVYAQRTIEVCRFLFPIKSTQSHFPLECVPLCRLYKSQKLEVKQCTDQKKWDAKLKDKIKERHFFLLSVKREIWICYKFTCTKLKCRNDNVAPVLKNSATLPKFLRYRK